MSIIDIEIFYELSTISLGFYFCGFLCAQAHKYGIYTRISLNLKNQQKNHLLDNTLDSKIISFTVILTIIFEFAQA